MINRQATTKVGADTSKSFYKYVLVNLDNKILKFFGKPRTTSLYGTFGSRRTSPTSIILGVGDVVQVTIFEAQAGGLFIPDEAGARPGNFVTLPPQQIDGNGSLAIPYAGAIRFAGRTVAEVQSDIAKKLANRAIEPQVLITLQGQRSSQVSVVGDVRAPTRIDINPAGDRIIDAIARTGGPSYPGYETYVTLERNGKTATVNFEDIVSNPRENVYVHPDDTIYLYREPARYVAFGATNRLFSENGRLFDFGARKVTLAEGIAKVGGLDDLRADARRVFLYRVMNREQLETASLDLTKFPPEQMEIPTIFQLDFSNPTAYFAAQNFYLASKDVLFVDNSGAYEMSKFLDLVSQKAQTVTAVNQSVMTTKGAKDAIRNW